MRKEMAISGIPNRLNYCLIFVMYTCFINVAASSIIHPGGPRVVEPWGWISFIDLVTDRLVQEF
jgi:hypothetical protein